MSEYSFSLQPFARAGSPPVQIEGKISRDRNHLKISYILCDRSGAIAIPPQKGTKQRRDELWQTTCFEFFLGLKHSPHYWEFNLAPSGDWNVYRFEDYRRGMREETAIAALPFEVEKLDKAFNLCLSFDLSAIAAERDILEVAIAAVVQTQGGEIGYWALTHSGAKADFHRRESFILEL